MLTGELRSQINAIWDAFWSGGISNPMEVLEQITYLLFIRRLDDEHTLEESKALILKQPMAKRIFPAGTDPRGRDYNDLRWSRFKNFAPAEMHVVVGEHVFPLLSLKIDLFCDRALIKLGMKFPPQFFGALIRRIED